MTTPCDNRDCPDCYPWEPPSDDDTFPWYVNATLFGLLLILALVVVAAAPKP